MERKIQNGFAGKTVGASPELLHSSYNCESLKTDTAIASGTFGLVGVGVFGWKMTPEPRRTSAAYGGSAAAPPRSPAVAAGTSPAPCRKFAWIRVLERERVWEVRERVNEWKMMDFRNKILYICRVLWAWAQGPQARF
ncbi:hypothetical protein HanXRQr2_Chr15g0720261 [Helianthus annuus]|uniref:Uncharacterized protein n=1 Tax=Helianthus annuus TaxID=4232 RepID=A0A9K3E4J1_HELAN|nr:hypothetical protein HanXRQr2_Chr15g0720261 [Helianthus annuus]KAJ0833482.1 hypothetical protein HanPSC8_Chr15g0690851 [Helianthus annuus]